jgi:hypothetical protein
MPCRTMAGLLANVIEIFGDDEDRLLPRTSCPVMGIPQPNIGGKRFEECTRSAWLTSARKMERMRGHCQPSRHDVIAGNPTKLRRPFELMVVDVGPQLPKVSRRGSSGAIIRTGPIEAESPSRSRAQRWSRTIPASLVRMKGIWLTRRYRNAWHNQERLISLWLSTPSPTLGHHQ